MLHSSQIFLLSLPILVQAYSSGAPKGACLDLTPKHNFDPQPNPIQPTHQIVTKRDSFGLGEKVELELTVPAPNQFKGFLIQARNQDQEIVGHFETEDPNVELMDCDAKEHSAITHVNAQVKQSVKATWIAPTNSSLVETGVKFFYTVVERKDKFWVGQQSKVLEFSNAQNCLKFSLPLVIFALILNF